MAFGAENVPAVGFELCLPHGIKEITIDIPPDCKEGSRKYSLGVRNSNVIFMFSNLKIVFGH